MEIQEPLYNSLIEYLGSRPLKEVYGLYTKLVMARLKPSADPAVTIPESQGKE